MATTLFLFATTHDTILAERLARSRDIAAELVPKPAGYTGRCGIALAVAAAAAGGLREILTAEGFSDFETAEG
jgi:hypothetical protein